MLPLLPLSVSRFMPTLVPPAVSMTCSLSALTLPQLHPISLSARRFALLFDALTASMPSTPLVLNSQPLIAMTPLPPSVSLITLTFEPLSAPTYLLIPASTPAMIPVLSSMPPTRLLPPLIPPPLPTPLRPPHIPQFAQTFAPPAAPIVRSPFAMSPLPPFASSRSSAGNLEVGRVENLRLFVYD